MIAGSGRDRQASRRVKAQPGSGHRDHSPRWRDRVDRPSRTAWSCTRIPTFAAAGLDAVEAFHPDHDAALVQEYVDVARRLRLLLTGARTFTGTRAMGASPAPSPCRPRNGNGCRCGGVLLRPEHALARSSYRFATSSRTTRPSALRVEHFELREAESVALLGFDQTAAEILVNLITGATLPDSGDVDVFGVSTRNIGDPDAWLVEMDRFGILSQRRSPRRVHGGAEPGAAVYAGGRTALKACARPFARSPRKSASTLCSCRSLRPRSTPTQLRIRLGRRWRSVPRPAGGASQRHAACRGYSAIGADLKAIAAARRAALLVTTADSAFAREVSTRTLTLNPATGEPVRTPAWRKWFR